MVWSKWYFCGIVLVNDEGYSAVVEFGCVTPTILSIKFRFARVKVCDIGVIWVRFWIE